MKKKKVLSPDSFCFYTLAVFPHIPIESQETEDKCCKKQNEQQSLFLFFGKRGKKYLRKLCKVHTPSSEENGAFFLKQI